MPEQAVPESAELIAAEIRSLRKGRGMQASDLDRRIGPHLRELAAGESGGGAVRRHALATELSSCLIQLPGDLRTAIMASLGLSTETRQMPHFKDRVSWLGTRLGYEYRTALRRIDSAEQLLAEEIARELLRRRGRIASSPEGWYLDEFRTVLRLDTPTPESLEHRRIIATRADLTEVMAWFDVPPGPDQARPALAAEILYGGRLVRREQPSGNRFQFVVQLPAPLRAGQAHEYGLILRVPEGHQMRPHYIFTPECQCNVFDLRVRFDLNRRPVWIRRVNGETVRMFDAARPTGDLASIDEAGELHLRFYNPTRYLGYGVQWQP
ncbi:MAG TPA: hypothetical protein VN840_03370 [Streptosporangiaceae bacterium]|nr:hypothetical protein [Streptosporangiaceae bacterium]